MTTEALKSNAITNYDSFPIVIPTSGEGGPASLKEVDDNVDTTAAGGATSTYRMARFPVEAKIKRVMSYIGAVDTNVAATWKEDLNIAFSDSTVDGTQQALQGLIPTSTKNGTTTTVAAYASPNILFGQKVAGNSGAPVYFEATHNGTFLPGDKQNPLWNYFGFVNNSGLAQSPGGCFDILVYVSVAAATAAGGHLGVEVDYVS